MPKPQTPGLTWLSVYRQRAGLTQRELAKAAGVSYPTMSKLERGLLGPSVPVARRIARELNATVDALFPDDDVPTPLDVLAPHMVTTKRRKK
jgi:putative transcriptional regulator